MPPQVIAAVVMVAATAASTAYSAVSSAKIAKEQRKAAEQARDIGDFNAANVRAETEEMARRQQLQNERMESTAQARAAATGFKSGTGSLATYINDLKQENQAELDWLVKSGQSKAEIEAMKGEYSYLTAKSIADATAAEGTTNLISGIGSTVSSAYSGGKTIGWWK